MTTPELSAQRHQTIVEVSRQGLVFAEASAVHVGTQALDDPHTQVYYLLYVLGAISRFGDEVGEDSGGALNTGEKLAAMSEALAAFETSGADEIRATVLNLAGAHESAAQAMRAAGRDAATKWLQGSRDNAARLFGDLLRDPANLATPLEASLAAIAYPDEQQ